jgi:hypothetical protein
MFVFIHWQVVSDVHDVPGHDDVHEILGYDDVHAFVVQLAIFQIWFFSPFE